MINARQIEYLREIVGKENILTTKEDMTTYAYDALSAESHAPDAVILPVNAEQIAAILKFASDDHIPVTPRGGGTNVSGGSIPIKGGIVLCTTRMNRILEINKANLVATVEPGVILLDFQNALAREKLFFPPSPFQQNGWTRRSKRSDIWCEKRSPVGLFPNEF